MVQKKGNLHMKDSRSSEERDQEDLDIMTASSVIRVPKPLQPRGSTRLRKLGKVCLNWHRPLEPVRELNSVDDKPLPGQGNMLCGDFQWE